MNSATMSEGTQLVSLKPRRMEGSREIDFWKFLGVNLQVKLESLILAQSERWRRA